LSGKNFHRIATGKNRLVLYPLDPDYRISSPERFAGFLVSCGFVDELSPGEESLEQMRPGENFMKLLTFVGCSPSVATDKHPNPYSNYSVEIVALNSGLTIIASNRAKSPVCPACGKSSQDVLAADSVTRVGDQIAWTCPECGAGTPIEKINWRNKLAIATDYLQINGVFEGESIPADNFLQALYGETGTKWSYCYC